MPPWLTALQASTKLLTRFHPSVPKRDIGPRCTPHRSHGCNRRGPNRWILVWLALGGTQLSSPKSIATGSHNNATSLQQALARAGRAHAGGPVDRGKESGGSASVRGVQEARRVGGEKEPRVAEEEAPAAAAEEEVLVGGEMDAAATTAVARQHLRTERGALPKISSPTPAATGEKPKGKSHETKSYSGHSKIKSRTT